MHSIWKAVLAVLLVNVLTSCSAGNHSAGTIKFQANRWLKSENSLIISWKAVDAETAQNQIDIYDLQGHTVVGMNVLHLVPDASRVTISDVSARTGGLVAVAAVYTSKLGARPAATLLIFDLHGNLSSAFSLEPSKEIERLAVDAEANIWTMTAHADDKDPASVPMVVEYTKEGKIAKEMLPRNLFPMHAAKIREGSDLGSPAMGFDSNGIWLWLPGSTELVTIPAQSGRAPSIVKTGVPTRNTKNWVPLNVFRESSGVLVAQVRDVSSFSAAYYSWSPTSKAWTEFKPEGCDKQWLIGVSESSQVYVRHDAGESQFCLFADKQLLAVGGWPSRQDDEGGWGVPHSIALFAI